MNNTIIEFLENGLYEGISLYKELLDCFKKESEALKNIDLDHLWNISREKNNLCAKINFIEQKFFSAVRSELDKQNFAQTEKPCNLSNWSHLPDLISDIVEQNDRQKLFELHYFLQNLKSQIDTMRKINTDTVEYSLQFLDEIISVITRPARQDFVYNQSCRYNHSVNNILMSREV